MLNNVGWGNPPQQELWMLLLKNPGELTDDELASLRKNAETIKDFLYRVSGRLLYLEAIRRYRKRKKELAQLPRARLENMLREAQHQREEILAARKKEVGFVSYDPVRESPPPIDSDLFILNELLEGS